MADSSLAMIDRYAHNMFLVSQKYRQLQMHCSSTPRLASTMNGLLISLGECLSAFTTNEREITIPTFVSIRKTLDRCSSTLESHPSKADIMEILSQLSRHPPALDKVVAPNTESLARLKRLEDSSRIAQTSLQIQATRLKQTAKNKNRGGHATALVGGLLGPLTFGWSLKLGVEHGNVMLQEGEIKLQESQHLQAQIPNIFNQFSHLIRTSISVMEELTGLLVTVADDVRALSTSRTKLQLLKARAKADNVSRVLARYITLSKLWSRNFDFYPYHRSAIVRCDNCRRKIDVWGIFYHAQTEGDFDLCGRCYSSDRDRSVRWTKHSKAQFVAHGFELCDGCHNTLNVGVVHYCGQCQFDVCDSCAPRCYHQHPLAKVQVRPSEIPEPQQLKCDECGCQGKGTDLMYECLECFLYYVCKDCKGEGKLEVKHPHELLAVSSMGASD
jgi:hypothetical protein